MTKPLRLGYTMNKRETKQFMQIDSNYVVTPKQVNLVKTAKKYSRTHPIKF
jgi:hypothetical protein